MHYIRAQWQIFLGMFAWSLINVAFTSSPLDVSMADIVFGWKDRRNVRNRSSIIKWSADYFVDSIRDNTSAPNIQEVKTIQRIFRERVTTCTNQTMEYKMCWSVSFRFLELKNRDGTGHRWRRKLEGRRERGKLTWCPNEAWCLRDSNWIHANLRKSKYCQYHRSTRDSLSPSTEM